MYQVYKASTVGSSCLEHAGLGAQNFRVEKDRFQEQRVAPIPFWVAWSSGRALLGFWSRVAWVLVEDCLQVCSTDDLLSNRENCQTRHKLLSPLRCQARYKLPS